MVCGPVRKSTKYDLAYFNIGFRSDNAAGTLKRIKDAFPELSPPDNNNWIPNEYKKENRPENTVIVAWVKTN